MLKLAEPVNTPVRKRYADGMSAVRNQQPSKDDITYSHLAMCQVYLPYTKQEADFWEVRQGNLTLRIQAARYDKGTKTHGLPYGTRARLLVFLLNELAIEQQSDTFIIAPTISRLTQVLNIGRTGPNINDIKEQFRALCTASFTFEWSNEEYSTLLKNFFIISELIIPKALSGMEDFSKVRRGPKGIHIKLDHEYFQSLMTKAIPLDKRAISALQNNPMCLDVYSWLAQRLHRIQPGKPQFVAWENVRRQFGWSFKRMKHFKAHFRECLLNVRMQYPQARIEEKVNEGYLLHLSPPPVPPKTSLVMDGFRQDPPKLGK